MTAQKDAFSLYAEAAQTEIDTLEKLKTENESLQAKIAATIRILSDSRFSHASRVSDARSILTH